MDKAIGQVYLHKVMHVRAHPVGYKGDNSFLYFEVHFTTTGKVVFPSPWELRAATLVRKYYLQASYPDLTHVFHTSKKIRKTWCVHRSYSLGMNTKTQDNACGQGYSTLVQSSSLNMIADNMHVGTMTA